MARRRGTPDSYAFELVPGDEVDAAPADAPPGDGLAARTLASLRATTRRHPAVTAGVAVGVVLAFGGGAVVASAVQDHRVTERLRSAPGGVVSLEGPLGETWSAALGEEGVLAVLAGGAILVGSEDGVAAVDVADGTERWRAELGDAVDCGPQPRPSMPAEWAVPSDVVVCLAGPAEAREVTVLAADGAVVGKRTLGVAYAAELVVVEPAAGGMLAVVERAGPLPGTREVSGERSDAVWAELEETGWTEGGDAVLRLEDAVSGEVIAEVAAPFAPVASLLECAVAATEDGDHVTVQFGPGEIVASPLVVEHGHCGVDVATTVDGTPLDAAPDRIATGTPVSIERVPYPDGGFVVSDDRGGSRLVDETGATVVDVRGSISVPMATDGTRKGVVVVDEYGSTVRAVDRDGTELWERNASIPNVVARAAGVVVLGGFGELTGVDVLSGEERWRTSVKQDPDLAWVQEPTGATTDGRTVLLSAMTGGYDGLSGRTEIVSVDLATGEVTRVDVETDGWALLVAVDGRPLALSVTSGTDDAGAEEVRATVSGLGPR